MGDTEGALVESLFNPPPFIWALETVCAGSSFVLRVSGPPTRPAGPFANTGKSQAGAAQSPGRIRNPGGAFQLAFANDPPVPGGGTVIGQSTEAYRWPPKTRSETPPASCTMGSVTGMNVPTSKNRAYPLFMCSWPESSAATVERPIRTSITCVGTLER